jgi:hypothetical protein
MYQCYVYLIKNKITNQFYYGSRAGNVRNCRHPVDDIWIHYFTSSKTIKNMIAELGVNAFSVSIVFENADYPTCYWKEQELIMASKDDPLRINRTYMNPLTCTRIFSLYCESTDDKLLRYKKISEAKKGKFNSNGHYGSKRTDETRRRMSVAQQNRVLTAEAREKIVAARIGSVMSVETKQKISEAKTGQPVSVETRQKLRAKSLENWQLRKLNKGNN